jgi:hypothetical protein
MIQNLFPTPVGLFDHTDLVKTCLDEYRTLLTDSSTGNAWDWVDKPGFSALRLAFNTRANELLSHCSRSECVEVKRGWLQGQRYPDVSPPHTHPWNILVAVFYLKAPAGSGDLLIQDPAAGSMWSAYNDINGSGGNVFKRITPYPGLMVVHPGHIVHSTAPNSTDAERLCFATSFIITSFKSNDYPTGPKGLLRDPSLLHPVSRV